MAVIELTDATFAWDAARPQDLAFRDLTVCVGEGEFVVLVGPSGCGKSTLLSVLAGLEPLTAGALSIDGAPVAPGGSPAMLVFQDAFLFPWLTVAQNVRMGGVFRHGGAPPPDSPGADPQALLSSVGLADIANKYPRQLSGGMKQRAVLARAVANTPRILLLDEPFSALDFQARMELCAYFLTVWARYRTTVVFVTHLIDEAILLADRILVMGPTPGRLVADLTVSLPRPRDLRDPAFGALRVQILDLLFSPPEREG